MLRKIINVLVVLPLAIIFIVFAVANRHSVTLSLDPFDSTDAALGITLPLFVVIIASAIFGVAVGGIATWFGQHKWRSAARRNESEARNMRAQLADLGGRSQHAGAYRQPQVPAMRRDAGLSAAQSPQYEAIGRDKPGATL